MSDTIFSFHELGFQSQAISHKSDQPRRVYTVAEVLEYFSKNDIEKYTYASGKDADQARQCYSLPVLKKQEDGYYDLLFVVNDKDVKDHSLTNPSTKKTRVNPRAVTEGYDIRAHVGIRIHPTNPYKAFLAIEREAGLAAERLRVFFNRFLESKRLVTTNEQSSFFFEDHPAGYKKDDGKPVRLQGKVMASVESIWSDDLLNAFKEGKINDVVLINKEYMDDIDTHGVFNQTQSELHFSVSATIVNQMSTSQEQIKKDVYTGFAKLAAMIDFKKKIPIEKQKFRIKYEDEFEKERTAYLNMAEHLELTLVKRVPIPTSSYVVEPISEVFKLNDSLCNRVRAHLKAQR